MLIFWIKLVSDRRSGEALEETEIFSLYFGNFTKSVLHTSVYKIILRNFLKQPTVTALVLSLLPKNHYVTDYVILSKEMGELLGDY